MMAPSTKLLSSILLLACLCWPSSSTTFKHIVDESVILADWKENAFEQILQRESNKTGNSLLRSLVPPTVYELTSPYQVLPGSYQSYDSTPYISNGLYNAKSIYAAYLASGAYHYHSKNCHNHYGQVPQITPIDTDNAFGYANSELIRRYPEYTNQSYYQSTAHKEVEGQVLELVSEYFAKYKCFSKYHLATFLPVISIVKQYQSKNPNGDISCSAFYNEHYECKAHYGSKYRTIDGSCNNPYKPYWGRSNVCHIRLIPADYSDGIQSFRMAKNGHALPNPRVISNYVSRSLDFKSYYTSLVLGWGQFINHDITNTVNYKKETGQEKIDCCVKPNYKCIAIQIENENDYLAVKYGKKGRCINLMRSSPCPLCKLGPREQMNGQTSFLDGSAIYGATEKESSKLRTFQHGLLISVPDIHGKAILPPSDDIKPCEPMKKGFRCFLAGDSRANQHPILLAMHTLWMRNHNIHAIALRQVNPNWNDEKLFQEARRITVAEIQHITYNEYLPVIMGSLLSNYYSLNPLPRGYTYYEPHTDPTSWNEYTTAASRYGHSQMKDYYKTLAANFVNSSIFLLKDNFFEPGLAWDGLLDDIVRGMTSEPSDTVDPYYSLTAKNFVMRKKSEKFGLDMVSVNIQRGRDHGLPGYVHYLKACFNYQVKSWNDLERFIPPEILTKLSQLYSSVEDIDLYIGGVSEKHMIDASIGPTFGCLVGIQFYHLKFGDRYFYEHGGQYGSFSPAQLDNIRYASSIARVLCRTGTYLGKIQPKPFYLPSGYNQLTVCNKYAEINYQLWKE